MIQIFLNSFINKTKILKFSMKNIKFKINKIFNKNKGLSSLIEYTESEVY